MFQTLAIVTNAAVNAGEQIPGNAALSSSLGDLMCARVGEALAQSPGAVFTGNSERTVEAVCARVALSIPARGQEHGRLHLVCAAETDI